MELPKEGTRVQAQTLAQLGGGEPVGGLANQCGNGVRQMAVAGKADSLIKPKSVLIELGQIGQCVKATIVIEAGQGTPVFETPPQGAQRSGHILHEFRQGNYFLFSPTLKQRGVCVLESFHGVNYISVNGTLYA